MDGLVKGMWCRQALNVFSAAMFVPELCFVFFLVDMQVLDLKNIGETQCGPTEKH